MTIIIRIFSDFCDSHGLKTIYEERLCEKYKNSYYGIDNYIYLTSGDDYTHAIILNTIMPVLKNGIPKKNVIGFALEPFPFLPLSPIFIEYARQNISKYFIGDLNHLPDPFLEGQNFMWHTVPSLKSVPVTNKKKCMSIMISQKKFAPGHQYRHHLAEAILRSNLPIDIFGRGHIYYQNRKDDRIKGDFKELEPYEEYDFHIAIENFRSNHYFTEKIMNPLICNTTPIYLGCHNIDLYFKDQIIHLSGNLENDIIMIQTILRNPDQYKKKIDVDLVKNKTCLIQNADKLFE
jgi:hypothetical protein